MGMDERAVTIRMPAVWLWLLRVGGAVLGCAAGFGVAPLVRWLTGLVGGAPGPLRVAAQLPTVVAVPVLTVVGAGVGVWLAVVARRESPVVTVAGDRVLVVENGSALHVARDRIVAVFTDGRDLVVLGADSGELVRVRATDLPTDGLAAAFERFGHPWRGTADPREAEFTDWVDGTPDLDGTAHSLLRERRNALRDKRVGAAADVLDRLRAHGVTVRDRRGVQQYRCRESANGLAGGDEYSS